MALKLAVGPFLRELGQQRLRLGHLCRTGLRLRLYQRFVVGQLHSSRCCTGCCDIRRKTWQSRGQLEGFFEDLRRTKFVAELRVL